MAQREEYAPQRVGSNARSREPFRRGEPLQQRSRQLTGHRAHKGSKRSQIPTFKRGEPTQRIPCDPRDVLLTQQPGLDAEADGDFARERHAGEIPDAVNLVGQLQRERRVRLFNRKLSALAKHQ